jgi:hypothetical protein
VVAVCGWDLTCCPQHGELSLGHARFWPISSSLSRSAWAIFTSR